MPTTANERTIYEAQTFINIISEIQNLVFEICENLPDGSFKNIMDNLGVAYKLARILDPALPVARPPSFQPTNIQPRRVAEILFDRLMNDRIYALMEARSRMNPVEKRNLTDAEKLALGYKCCNKCDRVVNDLEAHQERGICNQILLSKKFAKLTQRDDVSNLAQASIFIQARNAKKKEKEILKIIQADRRARREHANQLEQREREAIEANEDI
jgi:hypothetical protein